MFCRALSIIAMEAGTVMSTSCSVQVCGYWSVVSTTKSGEVDPIFAWEVLFAKEGSGICLVYVYRVLC